MARTKQSRRLTENWLRGLVSAIEIVRHELVFCFISLHVPQSKRCLTYSRAIFLPGIDCPVHLCLIFSLFPHLRWFSLYWHFHLGVAEGKWEEVHVKFHQPCNTIAISSSSKGLDRAFGERLWEHEGKRSLSLFFFDLWHVCATLLYEHTLNSSLFPGRYL